MKDENILSEFCSHTFHTDPCGGCYTPTDWKSKLEKTEAKLKMAVDALLNADRYFKAKDGVYFCDVDLCEKSAKYAVYKALEELEKQ